MTFPGGSEDHQTQLLLKAIEYCPELEAGSLCITEGGDRVQSSNIGVLYEPPLLFSTLCSSSVAFPKF